MTTPLPHSLPSHLPLGKTVPVKPVNITANKVSMGNITIQWTVPFVVYTLETYVVHYGSAPDNLNQSSILVNGSADLSVTGAQFGVNLTGLVPYSLYYYTIEASNTEGTTTTPVMTLSFFPRRFCVFMARVHVLVCVSICCVLCGCVLCCLCCVGVLCECCVGVL